MNWLWCQHANQFVNARMRQTLQNCHFSQQPARALVVDKNMLKSFARILPPCRPVNHLHYFSVCSFAELLHKLPLFGQTEVFVKAGKAKRQLLRRFLRITFLSNFCWHIPAAQLLSHLRTGQKAILYFNKVLKNLDVLLGLLSVFDAPVAIGRASIFLKRFL